MDTKKRVPESTPQTLNKGTNNHLNNKVLEPLKTLDWRDCLIDLAKPVPPPEPLLIQTDTDITMMNRRNISTIAASAKVGKTFLISALAAAAFSEESFFNFYCPFDFIKVLFIDTEMDTSDTQEVAKRVHRIIGLPTDRNAANFYVLNLREKSQSERLKYVENAVKDLIPDLVLLDGVVDLCENFNDIYISQTLVTRLTQLATENNCHICTALHVNKGNNELRGHLGAFLRQKGEITLLLTKKEAETPYIECKSIDSRRKPIDEFAFRINSEALPEIYEPIPKPPRTPKLDKLFTEIIPLPTSMSYADLWKAVAEKAKVKEAMAKRKIKQALESGILQKNEIGYYHLQKSINNEDETLPF